MSKSPVEAYLPSSVTEPMASSNMVACLMDLVVSNLKKNNKPWSEMSEGDQASALMDIEETVKKSVSEAVGIIAAQNFKSVDVVLGAINLDGNKIAMKLTTQNGLDSILDLANNSGSIVKVVMPEVEKYSDDMTLAPEAEEDQKSLDVDQDQEKSQQEETEAALEETLNEEE